MLCTFYFDVVTAVCQLLINGYVMLCYEMDLYFSVMHYRLWCHLVHHSPALHFQSTHRLRMGALYITMSALVEASSNINCSGRQERDLKDMRVSLPYLLQSYAPESNLRPLDRKFNIATFTAPCDATREYNDVIIFSGATSSTSYKIVITCKIDKLPNIQTNCDTPVAQN